MQPRWSAQTLVRGVLTAAILISLSLAAQDRPGEDTFSVNTCETPYRNEGSCPRPRFGWTDCPGQRGVPCDVCYGPDGPFAFVPRTNPTYKLSSGCDALGKLPPGTVIWANQPPAVRDRIEAEGGSCWPQGVYILCKRGDESPPPSRPASPEASAAEQIEDGWRSSPAFAPGVSYTSVTFGGDTLHAVRLSKPFVIGAAREKTTGADGKNAWRWSGKTVFSFVQEAARNGRNVVGGVTGTFSNWPARPTEPAGPVVSSGKLVEPVRRSFSAKTQIERSFLGYGEDGYFIADLPPDPDFASYVQKVRDLGAQEGLGGLGRLLDGGQDASERARTRQRLNQGQASNDPDARVVAGVDGGGRLILLVQQGDDELNKGAGMGQLARIFRHLRVTDAVILDGGGSTEIVLKRRNGWLRGGTGRALPTAILF